MYTSLNWSNYMGVRVLSVRMGIWLDHVNILECGFMNDVINCILYACFALNMVERPYRSILLLLFVTCFLFYFSMYRHWCLGI